MTDAENFEKREEVAGIFAAKKYLTHARIRQWTECCVQMNILYASTIGHTASAKVVLVPDTCVPKA